MKYVKELTEDEKNELRQMKNEHQSSRARTRAHSILLSNERYSKQEIAKIQEVDEDTVSRWLIRWTEKGIAGLPDQPRSGRPRILSKEEEEIVLQAIEEDPRSLKNAQLKVVEETNKKVSKWTVKRILKRANKKWKRMRKGIKKKPDEALYERKKALIQKVKENAEEYGAIDLVYFDESGFSLEPSVPYAWQSTGQTLEIPSSRSKNLSVLGFFSYTQAFTAFTVQGSVNSAVVIDAFDRFVQSISKVTYVLIDNASIHTSHAFKAKLPEWDEKGLILIYLPPYSPKLNPIEILWRFIKYSWLPLSAYQSFNDLKLALQHVLDNIGSQFRITFA